MAIRKLVFEKSKVPTGCYLLKVYSDDEYFNECNWLYVEITDRPKREILAAHDLVLQGKKSISDSMYAIKLWCSAAWWIHEDELLTNDNCDSELPDGVIDVMNLDEGCHEIVKLPEKDLELIDEIRADVEQLIVDEHDFRFQCYVKNTSILLYSESINVKILKP